MEFNFRLETYIGSMIKIVKSGIVKHKQDHLFYKFLKVNRTQYLMKKKKVDCHQ